MSSPEKIDIKIPDFEYAVLNEFFNVNDDIKFKFFHFFGRRIDEVSKGELDQEEYIKKWKTIIE